MNIEIYENIKKYVDVIDVVKTITNLTDYINDNLNKTDKTFKELLIKNTSFGTMIGNIVDALLPSYLSNSNKTNLSFIKGNDTKDPDCICLLNPFYNTECKTTCNKTQRIYGAKTNAGHGKGTKYQEDEYHFYIFTAFNKPTNVNENLSIKNIWIGMLKASDWSISESKGSGAAWINNEIFDERFINIKHFNIFSNNYES